MASGDRNKFIKNYGNPLQAYFRDILVDNTPLTREQTGVWFLEDYFSNGEGTTQTPFTSKNIPTVVHFISNGVDSSSSLYEPNYQGIDSEGLDYIFNLINLLRPSSAYPDSYINFQRATVDTNNNPIPVPGYNFVDASNVQRGFLPGGSPEIVTYAEGGMAMKANQAYKSETGISQLKDIIGVLPSQVSNLVTNVFPPDRYLNIYIVNYIRNCSEFNTVENFFPGAGYNTAPSSNQQFIGYPLVIPAVYGDYFNSYSECGIYISFETLSRLRGGAQTSTSSMAGWSPTTYTFGDVYSPNYRNTNRTSSYQESGYLIVRSLAHYFGLLGPGFHDVKYVESDFQLANSTSYHYCNPATGALGDFCSDTMTPKQESPSLNIHSGYRLFYGCGTNASSSTLGQLGFGTNIMYITTVQSPQNTSNQIFSLTSDQLSYLEHSFNMTIDGNPTLLGRLALSQQAPDVEYIPPLIYGCTDPDYTEYNPDATVDDGTCIQSIYVSGCTDPNYIEYNPNANLDNGTCITPIVAGCTDPNYLNYNPDANREDGSCSGLIVYGCTNPLYAEYKESANVNDGTCSTLIDTDIYYSNNASSIDGGCRGIGPRAAQISAEKSIQRAARVSLVPRVVSGTNVISHSSVKRFYSLFKSITNIMNILNNGKKY